MNQNMEDVISIATVTGAGLLGVIQGCNISESVGFDIYGILYEFGYYALPVVLLGLTVNKISQYSEERDKIKAKKRAD
jgi:hypothetical protein